jgi:hypothetical protein
MSSANMPHLIFITLKESYDELSIWEDNKLRETDNKLRETCPKATQEVSGLFFI